MADKNQNDIKRTWTKAPQLATNALPSMFHTSPRLNPVRVIAKAAASVEWALYSRKALRRDAETAAPLNEHELYELLENPCPTFRELDGWALRYLTFAHVRLVGEFFWMKVRDARGKPIALLPVPAAWVPRKPTISDHSFLVYPYGVTAGSALTVPQEDVVWFKNPDLLDPYANGRGDSEVIGDEIQSDEYAAKYQKGFFFNDASPKFAILADGANDQQVKQIKQNFLSKLAGVFHSREPAVITTRGASIQKLTETMVELDMINSRKYLRDECLQNYQIPPEIYGIIENSNRSTIDAADYLFKKNVLSYDITFFERVVTNQLCHDWDADLCLRHDNIITEDEEFALKLYQAGLDSGIITENEFRTRFRMPEKPDGDVRILPISLMRVPVGAREDSSAPADAKPSDTTVAGRSQNVQATALNGAQLSSLMEVVVGVSSGAMTSETARALIIIAFPTLSSEQIDNLILSASKGEVTIPEAPKDDSVLEIADDDEPGAKMLKIIDDPQAEARKCAIWKSFDAKAVSVEEPFRKAAKKIADIQGKKTSAAIKSALRIEQSADAVTRAINSVFTEDTDKAVKQTLAPAWKISLEAGHDHAMTTLSPGKSVKAPDNVYNEYFNTWIEANGLTKAKQIDDTTVEELQKTLIPVMSASVEAGDGLGVMIDKMAKAADDVFVRLSTTRAELIARTESAATVNAGTHVTYAAEGVKQREWLSVRDGRTRSLANGDDFDHVTIDGKIVDIDKPFIVSGESMMYPGDPSGASAGNICNCRCSIAPVFAD